MGILLEMSEFVDDLERLAASGLSRRRSSAVGLPLRLLPTGRGSFESEGSREGAKECGVEVKTSFRVLVMGSNKVGKTSIISQFLYDKFKPEYKATVQEMYRGKFNVENLKLSLDIEDTSGSFAFDFPAMANVSLDAADAVLLVYSVANKKSFEMVGELRDMVMKYRGPDMPMVVVGNKTDLERKMDLVEMEALVQCDWENAYVECSAKNNQNIQAVFRELLAQTRSQADIVPSISSNNTAPLRRPSLPVIMKGGEGDQGARRWEGRRGSVAALMGRDTCRVS